MRDKAVIFLLILIIGLYLSGCGGGDRIVRLENHTKTMQSQVEGLDEEITTVSSQMKDVQDSQKKVKTSTDNIEKRLAEIAKRLEEIEEETEELEEIEEEEIVEEAPAPAAPAPKASVKQVFAPRIKVLSGNASMPSAIQMARKIEGLGYKVDRVDFAPRSNFFNNTVYYASGSQDMANALVNKLGCGAAVKPMTWHSIFDIIVVTGHK